MYLGPGRQRDEATSATTASTQTKNATKKLGAKENFITPDYNSKNKL